MGRTGSAPIPFEDAGWLGWTLVLPPGKAISDIPQALLAGELRRIILEILGLLGIDADGLLCLCWLKPRLIIYTIAVLAQ
jgi:hypothetical protein